jgi:RHS repeat-associated protein
MHRAFKNSQRIRKCLLQAGAIFVLLNATVVAQQQSSGPTDNGVTAGFSSTYSGGYPVTGIDTINLYNGRVSLNLPLGKIGARGSVGYEPAISISRTWLLRSYQYWNPAGTTGTWSQPQFKVISERYNDSYDYSNFQPGLLPAVIIGRRTRDSNPSASGTIPPTFAHCNALTKLYLRMAGGEVELRDLVISGEPHNDDNGQFNRGREFHAVDGSGMLFISDTDIMDETCNDRDFPAMNGINVLFPTGDLKLEDGTRYRFVLGYPVWMRDRNGNTITFAGPSSPGPSEVTDSIGRKYQFSGGVIYKDHSGTAQTVTVTTGSLGSALRSDFAAAGVKTLQALLPGVLLEDTTGIFNPTVTKTVRLPNGLEYHFFYTEYGELARIEMPNGGAVEYDYPVGSGLTGPSSSPQVYRPAIVRRIFDSPGHLQSRQTFAYALNTYGITVTSVKTYDAADFVVSNERHTFKGDIGQDFQSTAWYQSFDNGRETALEMLDAAGSSILRRVDNTWETLDLTGAPVAPPLYSATHPTNLDCALTAVKTALSDTNQAAKTTFAYDSHGHKADSYDYDFGTAGSGGIGGLLRRTHTDFNNDSLYVQSSGAYILNLVSRQWVSSDANGTNRLAQTEFEYDNYTTDSRHHSLIDRASISGSCMKLNDTATTCLQASDSSYTKRGNLTQTTAYYDIPNSGAVITAAQYDIAGNAVKGIDARGYETNIDYLDSFGAPDGNAHGNGGSQELNSAGQYSYAFPTLVTNALGHTFYTQFNYYLGRPVDAEDANGAVTSLFYDDVLDRLTKISRPDGGRTTYFYIDTHQCGPYVETRTLLDSSGRESDSFQFFDGLGRSYRAFTYENQDTNNPYLTVDTQYDAMGRAWRVSNPYRSAGCTSTVNPSGRWTQMAFDALSRPTQITTADSAAVTTAYSGNTVTVTDQAGKKRRSVTDALGRLARVDEPDSNGNLGLTSAPAQPTSYTYDALGNLRKIDQGGQQRFFMYDSFGRLLRAKNPEQAAGSVASNLTDAVTGNTQWSMAYGYDNNGNLTARVDARNVTTTYAYDALNRNTTVRYTDGTKDIDRHYDGAIKGKGRFWYSNWDPNNNNTRFDSFLAIDEYDAGGRPKNYRQLFFTNGVASPQLNVTRTYDKAGHVLTQTYPSGHTVNYGYDIAGRLNSDTGNLGDGVSRTYSTGITYSELGGLQQEQFGTQVPLYHKLHYNVRGQLNDIRLSSVPWATDQWNWNRGAIVNYYATADLSCQTNECRANSGTDNNGNLIQSQHWIPANDQMSSYNWTEDRYSYDSLNRLKSVAEYHGSSTAGLSGQDFTQVNNYDRWGNRTIDQGMTSANVPHPNYTADTNTNRLIAPAGYSYSYDSAGNQTSDNYTGQGARTYDAENRMQQAQGLPNNQWQTYTYDADGRRIKRNVNGSETWQLYGMDGELLAEYQSGAAAFLATTEYGYRGGELLTTITSGDTQRLIRFVYNLYYGALQRDPTPAELQDKINQLAAAGAQGQSQVLTTATQIARSLFTSTNYETSPYRSDIQYTADLYYAYLQRGPDDSGLNFWAGQAASSRVNVCNAFEASGEFQTLVTTLYGTSTSDNQRTEQLVNNFYLGAYGRNATSTELQQQRDDLNAAAAQGQAQVQTQAETFGRSLFAAQVNDASLSNTQYVTNLYEAFLQRGPDAGGLGFWSGQASVGQGRQNVLGAFATCGAFRELAGTLYREANWLVADQLGTPQMIVNKSGTLAGVKRHDYLPFGEELFANTGGRTSQQGYSGDSVRQKFASKERDTETGLDFFLARYYSSTQGRFTSPDIFGTRRRNPQSWNRYSYVLNNPLKYTDPLGLVAQDPTDKIPTDIVRIVIHDKPSLFKRIFGKIGGLFKGGSRVESGGEEGEEGQSEEARDEEQKADEKDLFEREPWRDPNAIPPVPIDESAIGPDPETATELEEAAMTPRLNGETRTEQLKDALNRVAAMEGSPEAKAEMFARFASQISVRSEFEWRASSTRGTDGSHIFIGQQGELLVISPQGQLFRGSARTGLNFGASGLTPLYGNLRLRLPK